MSIEEKIDEYLSDELDEDYEESELQKLGYKKTATVGGGMSGKRKAGSVYTHPTTGKKKVVMKKSMIDRVKHAAGQIKKKITENMDAPDIETIGKEIKYKSVECCQSCDWVDQGVQDEHLECTNKQVMKLMNSNLPPDTYAYKVCKFYKKGFF